ncbi:hypothetical protein BWQ96_06480 [Gracilariopsis chorda]|uniref:Uncharacterized protein n=1 Tax=Gracilariopsis chorda TaxID=448386 RepID=A0A2V3INT8_9FLOR|nr:hypothetical protein BWQ96_06480 [Gracilariopsis chorda]|eukprot:PXF43748.1 hypothetical protein BWQ96_06480 [Gracilariopsis chorda]
MGSWRSADSSGSREQFIERFTSVENNMRVQQCEEIVFEIVALYRSQLLGGREVVGNEYNTSAPELLSFGNDGSAVNFRALLLSSFKSHGGCSELNDYLVDQHLVFVEISRDSLADVLTVRRFRNLVRDQLQPGKPGRPRYIVIVGDQPS